MIQPGIQPPFVAFGLPQWCAMCAVQGQQKVRSITLTASR
jgi:hypothetical protein